VIRLVQLSNGKSGKVALVKDPDRYCLENYESIYDLEKASVGVGQNLVVLRSNWTDNKLIEVEAIL
jgi:hypothetical protein